MDDGKERYCVTRLVGLQIANQVQGSVRRQGVGELGQGVRDTVLAEVSQPSRVGAIHRVPANRLRNADDADTAWVAIGPLRRLVDASPHGDQVLFDRRHRLPLCLTRRGRRHDDQGREASGAAFARAMRKPPIRMTHRTLAGYLDVLGRYSRVQESQPVGRPEIEVTPTVPLIDSLVFRIETAGTPEVENFSADLIAAWTDRRTDEGDKIARLAAKLMPHE